MIAHSYTDYDSSSYSEEFDDMNPFVDTNQSLHWTRSEILHSFSDGTQTDSENDKRIIHPIKNSYMNNMIHVLPTNSTLFDINHSNASFSHSLPSNSNTNGKKMLYYQYPLSMSMNNMGSNPSLSSQMNDAAHQRSPSILDLLNEKDIFSSADSHHSSLSSISESKANDQKISSKNKKQNQNKDLRRAKPIFYNTSFNHSSSTNANISLNTTSNDKNFLKENYSKFDEIKYHCKYFYCRILNKLSVASSPWIFVFWLIWYLAFSYLLYDGIVCTRNAFTLYSKSLEHSCLLTSYQSTECSYTCSETQLCHGIAYTYKGMADVCGNKIMSSIGTQVHCPQSLLPITSIQSSENIPRSDYVSCWMSSCTSGVFYLFEPDMDIMYALIKMVIGAFGILCALPFILASCKGLFYRQKQTTKIVIV